MARDGFAQRVLPGGARRGDRGQDAAAGRVQLLVGRSRGAQRELLDAVACKARVRVAVDEARDGTAPRRVELLDVAGERAELAHAPHLHDLRSLHEDVRTLDDHHFPQQRSAQRRGVAGRRHELRDVADEEAAHAPGSIGRSMSCSRAAAIASS